VRCAPEITRDKHECHGEYTARSSRPHTERSGAGLGRSLGDRLRVRIRAPRPATPSRQR
jgi:hypothetical protein